MGWGHERTENGNSEPFICDLKSDSNCQVLYLTCESWAGHISNRPCDPGTPMSVASGVCGITWTEWSPPDDLQAATPEVMRQKEFKKHSEKQEEWYGVNHVLQIGCQGLEGPHCLSPAFAMPVVTSLLYWWRRWGPELGAQKTKSLTWHLWLHLVPTGLRAPDQ